MSGSLDDDTLRSIQRGRASAGAVLGSAQEHLQKIFLVFVVGLIGSILVLQYGLWDVLRQDLLYSQMDLTTSQATRIIATNPFAVILLQFKIGLVVGGVLALPVALFYSRSGLRERGMWPTEKLPRWKFGLLAGLSLFLFLGGVYYAYELFFPIMFNFLAGNAMQAGFLPHYSIVRWVGFVVLLGVSFGLAAQLPLAMTTLGYSGIVPYETFRDKWKYAVVIIFVFGALFSPPDPFTQIMWAAPMCLLYALSLALTKFVVQTKRAGEQVGLRSVARDRWNVLVGVFVLAAGAVYYLLATDAFRYVKRFAAWFPSSRLTGDIQPPELFGLSVQASAVILGALLGAIAAGLVLYWFMVKRLDALAAEAGHFGDPTAIDVGELSAEAVRSAPPEVFAEMDEDTAMGHASAALEDDDHEKAEAIIDRFDAAQEGAEAEAEGGDAAAAAAATDAGETGDAADDEGGNVFSSTAAGMADAFTEDETTEDDIGGYYYDLRFIADSLTSRVIPLVGVFMLVMAATFVFLYAGIPGASAEPLATGATVVGAGGVAADNASVVASNVTVLNETGAIVDNESVLVALNGSSGGQPRTAIMDNNSTLVRNAWVLLPNRTTGAPGQPIFENATVLIQDRVDEASVSGIGILKNTFVSNLPPDLQRQVGFVTLHPVEHLVFIVKLSTILGFIATLPILLYFMWPALRERDFVSGNRSTLLYWGGTLFGTIIAGSVFGFLFVAPEVISWLAADALNSYMEISYRVAKFGWLVVGLTVGIGLLIEIPVTMVMFHRANILTYQRLVSHWRGITLGIFVVGALFTPGGIFTMFLLSIPIALMFLVGMGILWLYTLGGRRSPGKPEPAD